VIEAKLRPWVWFAIASSSLATNGSRGDRGRGPDQEHGYRARTGLPPVRFTARAEDAIKAAIEDWKKKKRKPETTARRPKCTGSLFENDSTDGKSGDKFRLLVKEGVPRHRRAARGCRGGGRSGLTAMRLSCRRAVDKVIEENGARIFVDPACCTWMRRH
jgi:hypothetical protein